MTGHVAIVMAVKDGARHLPAQLASIAGQTHGRWSLHVSDDGSDDDSLGVLQAFADQNPGRVTIVEGPREGAAANFLTALTRAGIPDRASVAWCDQDDIWREDRLAKALACFDVTTPVLFASRYQILTANGRLGRLSAPLRRTPTFGNALVQNPLPGHTMVANPAAADLLRGAAEAALQAKVPFHDWWTCQLLIGAGAGVVFDPAPGVLYRQHAGNLVGARGGFVAGLERLKMILDGRFSNWLERNTEALKTAGCLTAEASELLDRFGEWRKARAPRPPLSELGIWRQDRAGGLALSLAARLGKI